VVTRVRSLLAIFGVIHARHDDEWYVRLLY
jgi:hypothetical protein